MLSEVGIPLDLASLFAIVILFCLNLLKSEPPRLDLLNAVLIITVEVP